MNGNNILNRFLEIAVYPAAGGDSRKQFAKIIIGKDQRSCSLGHFCSFYSHCHTYMCSLKRWTVINRSEEHTSELQSRENLVCRLLLEKKNSRRSRRHAMH